MINESYVVCYIKVHHLLSSTNLIIKHFYNQLTTIKFHLTWEKIHNNPEVRYTSVVQLPQRSKEWDLPKS